MDPFSRLLTSLYRHNVRFVVIGVWGANYYAHAGAVTFRTRDRDLFLPPEPGNLLGAWRACEESGLELMLHSGPLDMPRDQWLAERVVEQRALTRAVDGVELEVDLTMVMAGFDFESVWTRRRTFQVEGVEVPVARLSQIVQSKAAAGRAKDLLFLETHRENLEQLLDTDDAED